MAHYAFLDENNVVTEVIPGRNEDEVVEGISDWEEHYGEFRGQVCKRTSYNTYGGVNEKGTAFRKNYAIVGGIYDPTRDAFIEPKPEGDGWVLNETTCLWENPTS
jgi:hypothetical protein